MAYFESYYIDFLNFFYIWIKGNLYFLFSMILFLKEIELFI